MFNLYDKNYNPIVLDNVKPLDIEISSIEKENIQESRERQGYREYGSIDRSRDIKITFIVDNDKTEYYRRIRTRVYDEIKSHEYFYVEEKYQPNIIYTVTSIDAFTPERFNGRYASFDIPLQVYETPYGKTIRPITKIDKQVADTFMIANNGHKIIHPFDKSSGLKITLSNFQGSEGAMTLTNLLNNSDTGFLGKLEETDVLVFDGPVIKLNDANAFNRSDKRYIQFSRGENHLVFRGISGCHVKVEFRELFN